MSQAGWYPDPGGAPGRYRYWDGRRWSDETSTRPGGSSGRRRNPGVLFAILAVVAVVVVALTVRFLTGPTSRTADEPLPSSTVTGGDDRSPTPLPSSATPTPTNTPTPSGLEDCPVGDPNARADHPNDPTFVYGGNLTITNVGEFEAPSDEPRMSFAWDVSEQIHIVSTQPGWIAQFALGQVRGSDGFTGSARRVAEKALQCTVTSRMYTPYDPVSTTTQLKARTVSGRAGFEIRATVAVNKPGLPFAGDDVTIVVVPDGENWGLYFSAVPTGDAAFAAIAERTVQSLRAH